MQRFIVCALDVWESANGFQIDDMWVCGQILLNNRADFRDIVNELVKNECLPQDYTLEMVKFHGDKKTLYVDELKTGKPLLHLYECE